MRQPEIGKRIPISELRQIDLETGDVEPLGEIPRTNWGPEISISPDSQWVGWTGEGAS